MSPDPDAFRAAALRASPAEWRGEPDDDDAVHERHVDEMVQEPVVSPRGVRAYAEPPVTHRRFSLGATFLGWSVAAFFTVVFSVLAAVALGAAPLDMASLQTAGLATVGFVAYVVSAFLAYVIGGYAAGRIALWNGVRHGVLTVAWAVLVVLVYAIASFQFAAQLAETTPLRIEPIELTTALVTGVLIVLAAMLGGAAMGGMWGERYHDRVHGVERGRRSTRMRGRPL